jgi:hypothetical protein
MLTSKINQLLLGALLSLFCLGQAVANAIVSYPVGPIPSLTGEAGSHGGLHTSHPFIASIFGGPSGWCVAIDCDPSDGDGFELYTITADPQAAVWIKELLPPEGQTAPFPFDTPLVVAELLHVGPGPAWTDWHEEILTEGWDWLGGFIQTGTIGVDIEDIGADVSLSPDGRTISFDFDPVLPSNDFLVIKFMHCSADNGCAPQSILVAEHPTIPEPASLALIGVGLAGLGWVRRRRA